MNLERIMEGIRQDLIALWQTISEDDSFMKAENWVKKPRQHSENTIRDSKAIKNARFEMEGNIFYLYYADYLEYVNYGRHPNRRKPPFKAIRDWCISKGIDTDNKTVFAIMNAIAIYGIKPRPIVSIWVQNLDKLWEHDWSERIINEITSIIDKQFNN